MTLTTSPALDGVPTDLLIGGTWRPAAGGARTPVHNPATGEVIATVADGATGDGHAALDAAVDAQASWAATPARERGEILRRAHDLMLADIDRLATIMTLEMGKPLAEARGEVRYAAEFFRWFSEEAVRLGGHYGNTPDGGSRGPTAIAKALGGKSSGAVSNALDKLVESKTAVKTKDKPRRFALAPTEAATVSTPTKSRKRNECGCGPAVTLLGHNHIRTRRGGSPSTAGDVARSWQSNACAVSAGCNPPRRHR